MGTAALPKYIGDSFRGSPPGHLFGLYLEIWSEGTWKIEKEKKTGALKKVLQLGGLSKQMLEALRGRQRASAWSLSEDRIFFLLARSTSPFMTGIGMEHPLENGFAFMNPYGLPYLPGSSVKGVLRKAAEDLALGLYGNNRGWSILDVWWLFGFEARSSYLVGGQGEKVDFLKDKAESLKERYNKSVDIQDPANLSPLVVPFIKQACKDVNDRDRYLADQKSFLRDLAEKKELRDAIQQRGALIFWDVFPAPDSDGLSIDILTPHYGEYYEGKSAPADCGQPIPCPFLTMPPESLFEFYVQYSPPTGVPEGRYDEHWKSLLETAFTHAFEWLGFGAKTSVGYGQMSMDEGAQKRLQKDQSLHFERKRAAEDEEKQRREEEKRKAELESMTPEERDIAAVRDPSVTENRVVEIYGRIDAFSGDNKKALARALKEYWIAHGKWKKKQCSKKQWEKVQKIKEILGED